jgi:hypothetical protein
MPTAYNLLFSAAEIRAVMERTHGNVCHAAELLGISQNNLRAHAKREGLNIPSLRRQLRSRMFSGAVDAPSAPVETPAPSGEPQADGPAQLVRGHIRLTLADYALLQSRAAMWAEAERLQTELDRANLIIASLLAKLEAIGAHMERAA